MFCVILLSVVSVTILVIDSLLLHTVVQALLKTMYLYIF